MAGPNADPVRHVHRVERGAPDLDTMGPHGSHVTPVIRDPSIIEITPR